MTSTRLLSTFIFMYMFNVTVTIVDLFTSAVMIRLNRSYFKRCSEGDFRVIVICKKSSQHLVYMKVANTPKVAQREHSQHRMVVSTEKEHTGAYPGWSKTLPQHSFQACCTSSTLRVTKSKSFYPMTSDVGPGSQRFGNGLLAKVHVGEFHFQVSQQ